MVALENERGPEADLETVWCAHCTWSAVRTWPRYLADTAWAMRVVHEHIQERHPERLARSDEAASDR